MTSQALESGTLLNDLTVAALGVPVADIGYGAGFLTFSLASSLSAPRVLFGMFIFFF
jgi:hypothetical protein